MKRHDLRSILEAVPADTQFSARGLLKLLDVEPTPGTADPTVESVAEELGRAPSTVRGWCPRIPGAYKANGHEWRIPRIGLRRFLEGHEREETAVEDTTAGAQLREWRPAS